MNDFQVKYCFLFIALNPFIHFYLFLFLILFTLVMLVLLLCLYSTQNMTISSFVPNFFIAFRHDSFQAFSEFSFFFLRFLVDIYSFFSIICVFFFFHSYRTCFVNRSTIVGQSILGYNKGKGDDDKSQSLLKVSTCQLLVFMAMIIPTIFSIEKPDHV